MSRLAETTLCRCRKGSILLALQHKALRRAASMAEFQAMAFAMMRRGAVRVHVHTEIPEVHPSRRHIRLKVI
ncbi:hypothetical protein CIT26_27800 [Mesorhizobium temperatum]|uniref:Uncharacterized protein n=1 Tax=Mesorhizobium temperatum TaxID=241416 RepID=A0A271LF92_9HYPH|nr:hypothetical protein CIT26_27800 [Mesorhizobium temperatum]